MKRTPFGSWPCSIARTVDLLGDWWTPLVLREAYYDSKRFGEFEAALKIGRNILTQRLNRRAGHADGDALFDAIVANPAGVTFTADGWDDVWAYVRRPDRRFTVAIPELLSQLPGLNRTGPGWVSDAYPFVLTAGERRSFTANTIIRDPRWRRRDTEGALRISAVDAARLGLSDGDPARVSTERGSAEARVEITDAMQPGHVSLPNGYGVDHPEHGSSGVAPNELTSLHLRDPIAGTPWHKHVPARVEPVTAAD
ncbi:molybdopterin dinucleotide binding domain-containing protein [Streptomyces oryzae]|uniref:molybdopterin dinucleotide binding domain-containing protein n=1 Tax=Streptomyces oryzae TaxID=1434886 RepID=UPI0027DB7773|nr:molybdopterin dinucleotide binding domain-containing protein [Streptomyces oryzae]